MFHELDKRFTRAIPRRAFLAGAAAVGISAGLSASPGAALGQTPKTGGNLRVAILGGGAADTLDANSNVTQPDTARVLGLYEPLRSVRRGGEIENVLAQSVESNADGTEWTIRLREGVTFHNGKDLTAEDVAFTLRRVTDPAKPLVAAPGLSFINRDAIKAVDAHTLQVPMHAPFAIFDEVVADDINLGIVPVDYDPRNPVGTGAFNLDSFTPGQQSVFTRFDGYWGQRAYLDSLTIINSFGTDTAALYALQGGEIDAFAAAPLTLASQVQEGGPIKILQSDVGQWTPFTMRVNQPPFDNPDVRMALRLLVDRDQIIKIALNGFATPGNDVFSLWDAAPATFKRSRDVEQAKALLKKAGQENLTIELVTSDIANGVVASAQIFARQAKDAGVTVTVKQVTPEVFFGDGYLKWPFAQDFWTFKPYLPQVALCQLANSPYNETHWTDENYAKLYNEAVATVDPAKRADLVKQLQTIDFEQGGYIIPSHNKIIDLVASNVNGLTPGAVLALGDYRYENIWLG